MDDGCEVAVVGAGAAGIGVAAELRRRGIADVVLFEGSDQLGRSWRARYDGLRLNTVRQLSGVPGHPIPRGTGPWPSRDDFVAYLEAVARRTRLDIRFGVAVDRVDRKGGRWALRTAAGPFTARFVVVATGYDRVPKMPAWPGRDSFTGELFHASCFRTTEPFAGRDVLVVGTGNSGTEIAARLAGGCAARVRVSVRTPPNIMPPTFLGIPATVLARMNETAPAGLVDRGGFMVQRLAWGDLSGYGLPRAPHGIATELEVRGLGATLDRGFVEALKSGRLELVPAIEALDGPDVVLASGDRITPEVVIAATGYHHGLEPLVGHLGVLLPSGKPALLTDGAAAGVEGLYFNGFWLPLSGQLPAMRRTSRRVARAIARERRRSRRDA